jgi:hypothetical protein
MITDRVWISAAVLVLFSFPAVQAQRALPAPRVSTVRAHPVPTRSTAPARASSRSLRSTASTSGSFAGNTFGLFNQFPALGLFGSGSPGWILAAIDPATQWRLFEAEKFARNVGFSTPGFYLLGGGAYYAPSEPAEAEPAPQEQSAETGTAQAERFEQQPVPAESAPPEDVGQFVLVLRSGSQVEAVAFTRADDHIIYVTADGLRRTLAIADLDPAATIRINEERGTPLEIRL